MNRREIFKKGFLGAAVAVAGTLPIINRADPKVDSFVIDTSSPLCRHCGYYQQVEQRWDNEKHDIMYFELIEVHPPDCPRYPHNLERKKWDPSPIGVVNAR